MSEIAYPKLKYQGVEIKPGQHHTENPGYIYQRVANPDEENALDGDWHDTPRQALDAFKANAAAAIEQRKTEKQEQQARERGIPPAGGDGGGAPDMPGDDDEKDDAGTVGAKDHEGRPRRTEEWPAEKAPKAPEKKGRR